MGTWHMAWTYCVHYCIQCASVYIHYTYTLCIEGRIDSYCMHAQRAASTDGDRA